jgi:N6-L-threonylcarbamoyladenine synthase
MITSKDLDFSFSGLKTAVLYAIRETQKTSDSLPNSFVKGLCREFEDAVAETLSTKLQTAIEETGAQSIIIGGGVTANTTLRKEFENIASRYNIPIFMPSKHISGDNALMIALAGALNSTLPSRKLKAHGTKRLGE